MAKARQYKRITSFVMAMALVLSMFQQVVLASDYSGHWAEKTIDSLLAKGVISGDDYGNINPEKPISRAQFAKIMNHAFNIMDEGDISKFTDVKKTDWFYSEIARAYKAGYFTGDAGKNTMRPNSSITRQEAAAVVGRYMDLQENASAASTFNDASQMASWAKGYIGALSTDQIITGYKDGSFKPLGTIKRAEAFTIIDKVMEGSVASEIDANTIEVQAGQTYGSADKIETVKNVVVKGSGAKLMNLIITGDLTIADGVGEGDVTLEGVTVKGNTIVNGGGANSIHIKNSAKVKSDFVKIKANKNGVSIKVESGTVAVVAFANGGALIVSAEGTVTMVNCDTSNKITLTGKIDSVVVSTGGASVVLRDAIVNTISLAAQNISLSLTGKSDVNELTIEKAATGAHVNVDSNSVIDKAVVDAKTTFSGNGEIKDAQLNIKGSTFEKAPDKTTGESAVVVTPSGGGGGGGGGGDTGTGTTYGELTFTTDQSVVNGIGSHLALTTTRAAIGTTVTATVTYSGNPDRSGTHEFALAGLSSSVTVTPTTRSAIVTVGTAVDNTVTYTFNMPSGTSAVSVANTFTASGPVDPAANPYANVDLTKTMTTMSAITTGVIASPATLTADATVTFTTNSALNDVQTSSAAITLKNADGAIVQLASGDKWVVTNVGDPIFLHGSGTATLLGDLSSSSNWYLTTTNANSSTITIMLKDSTGSVRTNSAGDDIKITLTVKRVVE